MLYICYMLCYAIHTHTHTYIYIYIYIYMTRKNTKAFLAQEFLAKTGKCRQATFLSQELHMATLDVTRYVL
jgi:hypothetical protein